MEDLAAPQHTNTLDLLSDLQSADGQLTCDNTSSGAFLVCIFQNMKLGIGIKKKIELKARIISTYDSRESRRVGS